MITSTESNAKMAPSAGRCCCFGLHPIPKPNKPTPKHLPLQKVDIKAHIKGSIAKVEFTQVYFNDTDALLEVEYFFPIPNNACFDSFKATYEGTVIEGLIKEKKQAKEEYKQNIKEGNTAAYAEINEETGDIMKVQVGNIKPLTPIEITFSYLQQLEVVRNSFYRFAFHSTITPRYNPGKPIRPYLKGEKIRADLEYKPEESSDIVLLSKYPQLPPKKGYLWNIEATIECVSPITHLECTSHKTEIQDTDNPCKKKMFLLPLEEFVFDKDFVFFFSESDFNVPTYRLAKNETGYCAMIDFVPKFSDEPLSDAAKAAREKIEKIQLMQAPTTGGNEDNDDVNLMTATGEYIFLIDRSGSMGGDRIEMAKEALIYALKSLPPNSFFNIISFGSDHKWLYRGHAESTEKTVEDAINNVKAFKADMGGTNILQPIYKAMSFPRRKNHPRTVFLLTDGAVGNTAAVLNCINAYSHCGRVFALGIGNGCSTELVQGCADRGMGKAAFVTDPKDIAGSVISLMTSAVVPVCDDFKLEYSNQNMVLMVSPNPTTHKYLLRDERATFFVFIHHEAAKLGQNYEVTLSCFDTYKNEYSKNKITIDLENYESSLDVFKLGIWKTADLADKKNRGVPLEMPIVYWDGKKNFDEEIVKLSVQNQVLTKKTAFICVIKENSKDEIGGLKKVKEIVPQVLSADYASQKIDVKSFEFEAKKRTGMVLRSAGARGGLRSKATAMRSAGDGMMMEKKSVSKSMVTRDEEEGEEELAESPQKSDIGSDTKTTSQLKSEAELLEIIQKQKMHGYWEISPELIKKIGMKEEDLLGKVLEVVKNAKGSVENVAITLAILVWIEKYHQDKKAAWTMIHKKGQQWLGAQGVKYAEVAPLITCL